MLLPYYTELVVLYSILDIKLGLLKENIDMDAHFFLILLKYFRPIIIWLISLLKNDFFNSSIPS